MQLTNKQKQVLKAKAHHLKPIVLLGNKGLSTAVIEEIDSSFNVHELIKVKLSGLGKKERTDIAQHICDKLNATLIQHVGTIISLYRKNEEE